MILVPERRYAMSDSTYDRPKEMEVMSMYTWFNGNSAHLATLVAEDTGAPELRNPLNSAIRAQKNAKSAAHPLRALRALVASLFAM